MFTQASLAQMGYTQNELIFLAQMDNLNKT
jgi:hypothetical protein